MEVKVGRAISKLAQRKKEYETRLRQFHQRTANGTDLINQCGVQYTCTRQLHSVIYGRNMLVRIRKDAQLMFFQDYQLID